MTPKLLQELLIQVTKLQSDVDWIKKYIWICVTASVTAAFSTIGQLLFKMMHWG